MSFEKDFGIRSPEEKQSTSMTFCHIKVHQHICSPAADKSLCMRTVDRKRLFE